MHPSGYTRETAIRAMDENPAADDLPRLAVRASDWVEPVRQLAYESIRRRLVPECFQIMVQSLPLLNGLQVRQRFDAAQLSPISSGPSTVRPATGYCEMRSTRRILAFAEPLLIWARG